MPIPKINDPVILSNLNLKSLVVSWIAFCMYSLAACSFAVKIDPISLKGVLRNMEITIKGKIKTVSNGKISYISRHHNYNSGRMIKIEMIEERAASVASLQEIINSMQIVQMQEIYNVMENRNEIKNTINMIRKVILFISKRYPSALADIIGGNFKTKWINNEVFQTCPCMKNPEIPIYSNCNGNLIFKEGDVLKIEDKEEECISINEDNIKNITLSTSENPLDIEEIDYLPPKTSSSDDTNWDWLTHRKNEFHDQIEDEVKKHNKEGLLDSINPLVSFKDILLYFCTAISLLFLIEKLIIRYRAL